MRIFQGVSGVSLQSTRYLNDALRSMGHVADSYTYRENFLLQSMEDYCLKINTKKWWFYPIYFVRIVRFFLSSMKKYDVFHFHYGHSFLPYNLDLPILKRFGKVVVMEYHGSEIRYLNNCVYNGTIHSVEDEKRKAKSFRLQSRIEANVDSIIIHDTELEKNLLTCQSKVHIVPLRIDISKFDFVQQKSNKRITIVHAPSKRNIKGTKFIISAIEHLKTRYDLCFILVENMDNNEAREIYRNADIIVDQLLIGSYGMFAIECMAYGKPVICYLDNESEKIGIINANVNNLEIVLEKLIQNPTLREECGRNGRLFVETKHDSRLCALQLLNIYQMALSHKDILEKQ